MFKIRHLFLFIHKEYDKLEHLQEIAAESPLLCK